MNRSRDWMEQAKWDLEHARKSMAMGDFDWACFAAQQAAEKAAKALHLAQGTVVWGHSVLDLLEAFPAGTQASSELKDAGRRLDRCYIAPRYPDAHPAGSPRRYYTEADARQSVADAGKVVNWCDQNLSSQP
jgi:HEPN domain-containing protein